MVSDNTERNVGLIVSSVLYARNIRDMLHDILNCIDLEDIIHALHYASETLKSHTGVEILAYNLSVVTVSVAVELAEHEVPDLDNTVAVACLLKIDERTVAVTSGEVDLRAGTAGT